MKWTKNIFISLFILSILLLFLETLSAATYFFLRGHNRWFEPKNIVVFANDHLSKHHIENSVMRLKHYPNFVSDLQIDKNGLIATVNNLQGYYPRLLLMGGSTVEGRGSSSNGTTIASYLSSCLASVNIPHEVLNGGRSGQYSYTEYRIMLESFLPKFKPAIVVSLNGFNDFALSLHNKPNEFLYHSDVRNSKALIEQDRNGIRLSDYLKDLYVSTHLFSVINSISRQFFDTTKNNLESKFINLNDFERDKRAHLVANHFKTQIANTNNIVEAYHSSYIHFLQPTLMLDKRKITDTEKSFITAWEKRTPLEKNFLIELEKFYEAYKKLNQLSVDISDLFNGRDGQQLYVDSSHYNSEANKIVAYSICDYIFLNRGTLKIIQ